MTIKELYKATGWSQPVFASYFGIPMRTLQDWIYGTKPPKDYVVNLIEYKLIHEKIIKRED